jgi:hypothetical protein
MDATFWRGKWARNEIGFHGDKAHSLRVQRLGALALPADVRTRHAAHLKRQTALGAPIADLL